MKRLFLAFAFVFVLSVVPTYTQTFDLKQHLGTWTPQFPQQDSSTYTPVPEGCVPHNLVFVARHGNRFPTSSNVRSLNELQKRLNATQPNQAFSWLKSWVNPIPTAKAGQLSPSGQQKMYDIAKRFKSYFPKLLNVTYNPDTFYLRSSYVSRAAQSGISFAYGLFEGAGDLPGGYLPAWVTTGSETSDSLMRFYDICPKLVALSEGPEIEVELNKWQAATFPTIAAQMSALTGIANLTNTDVAYFWTACQMEVGVFGKTDRFCSLFSEETILMMEYAEDLEQWWTGGFAFDVNWQSAAPLLQEIVKRLNESASSSSPSPRMYFGHSETIFPLASILGFFKDDQKLMANASAEFIRNRRFRSSLIAPFGANFGFTLYKCAAPEFKVKFMLNEKEMTVPGCTSVYCPLSQFISALSVPLSYNFNDVCALPTSPPSTAAPTTRPPSTTASPTTPSPTTPSPTTPSPTTRPPPTTPSPTTAAPSSPAPTARPPTPSPTPAPSPPHPSPRGDGAKTIININFANMLSR